MNRFLTITLLCIAALLAGWAILFLNYLNALGGGALQAKTVWAAFAVAVLLALAAWRLSVRAKFGIFAILVGLLLVELVLQATAWLGVLPGVSTKLKVPFARVYWRAEGRGNSIRNRYGWYYPAFDLKAPRRIALIGDSQVEAVEVPPTRNQAAVLQSLLREKTSDWAVLGLGSHGTCIAHSVEVLDYAYRHFQPQEAIIVVSVGSDITEASPELNDLAASQYIYYDLGTNGSIALNPASEGARNRFDAILELGHRSLLVSLPVIVTSHCMMLQTLTSIRDALHTRRRQAELAARAAKERPNQPDEFQQLGFNPAPFATNREPLARQAMEIVLGQVSRCQEICKNHGVKMRLVTIPAFPKPFYDSQHGTNWTMQIGKYDYLEPERELTTYARSHEIPVLSIGEYLQSKKPDVEEIRSLYLSNGMGHLTEKGHRLCAQAIFNAFYK